MKLTGWIATRKGRDGEEFILATLSQDLETTGRKLWAWKRDMMNISPGFLEIYPILRSAVKVEIREV